jgi:flotillin
MNIEAISSVWVIVGLIALGTFLMMGVLAKMFRKAGPHEALIVYGFRGTRIVQGSGTIIFPMVESCRELSLELMSFDVAPQQDLYTVQGVAVTVEAVAQIKVKSDPESIRTAAEQFLTKTPDQREGLIRLVMEGHLRGIIGQLTVEQIVKEPEMVADRMRSTCADDMNKMGLEVVSFTIKEVRDKNEYISNMGRPDVARIKRDADAPKRNAPQPLPRLRLTRNASPRKLLRSRSRLRRSATWTSSARIFWRPPRRPRRKPTRPTKSKPISCSSRLPPKRSVCSRWNVRRRSRCRRPKSRAARKN